MNVPQGSSLSSFAPRKHVLSRSEGDNGKRDTTEHSGHAGEDCCLEAVLIESRSCKLFCPFLGESAFPGEVAEWPKAPVC